MHFNSVVQWFVGASPRSVDAGQYVYTVHHRCCHLTVSLHFNSAVQWFIGASPPGVVADHEQNVHLYVCTIHHLAHAKHMHELACIDRPKHMHINQSQLLTVNRRAAKMPEQRSHAGYNG